MNKIIKEYWWVGLIIVGLYLFNGMPNEKTIYCNSSDDCPNQVNCVLIVPKENYYMADCMDDKGNFVPCSICSTTIPRGCFDIIIERGIETLCVG